MIRSFTLAAALLVAVPAAAQQPGSTSITFREGLITSGSLSLLDAAQGTPPPQAAAGVSAIAWTHPGGRVDTWGIRIDAGPWQTVTPVTRTIDGAPWFTAPFPPSTPGPHTITVRACLTLGDRPDALCGESTPLAYESVVIASPQTVRIVTLPPAVP